MHPIGTGYYYNLFTISNYPQKGPPKWQPNKTNEHETVRGDPKEIPKIPRRSQHARSRCQQVARLAARKVIVRGLWNGCIDDFTWLPSINYYGEQVGLHRVTPFGRLPTPESPGRQTYLIIEWLPPSRLSALLSTRNHLGINNVFV